jgi:urease accessory protein
LNAELRLLQLVSPALPVGAFAYSEGLETAVAEGWVGDEESARRWILARLRHGPARLEAPILKRLLEGETERWNDLLWAFREARELREADLAMGRALARLLVSLGVAGAAPWVRHPRCSYAAAFAVACRAWAIPVDRALSGFLWSWLEAQTTAAVKLVPLGQTAGQRILSAAIAELPALVAAALDLSDDDLGALAPGAAIAAARHEALEVRLFRS